MNFRRLVFCRGRVNCKSPADIHLIIYFLALVFILPLSAYAQIDDPPKDAAPPPLRSISGEERKLLEAQSNGKKRTQLCLEMMETRLKTAEEMASQNRYQDVLTQLGGFQGLLEHALGYLAANDIKDRNDENFKRLEIGIRRTVPRLEIVRREVPFQYGYHIQKIQKFVREARAKAMEPLFGEGVIRTETQSVTKSDNP